MFLTSNLTMVKSGFVRLNFEHLNEAGDLLYFFRKICEKKNKSIKMVWLELYEI